MLKRLAMSLILVLLPLTAQASPVECLAKNIYFEAKSQSFAGQAAVALVVLNRVKDKRYPNTVCDVIYEGPTYESWKTRKIPELSKKERVYYPRRDRCQFSWYCDGKADKVREESAYQKAHKIAWLVLHGHIFDFTEGATHYHADYVSPKWNKQKNMIKIVLIDNHIFYRLD
tara:strand:- start:124 stop:639 length:516 start_codon:yes stop_codon:yes gene_type:complete